MKDKVFLLPGEFHATKKPSEIVTVLGSCVSVCLWHRSLKAAAMNHFVFPELKDGDDDRGRYGDLATDLIIRSLFAMDANPRNYSCQVFGGGNPTGHNTGIGERNVQMALDVVGRYGFAVNNKQVGAQNGCRIYFDTVTGEVEVQEILTYKDRLERGQIKRKRVLIVDDSPTVCKVLSAVFDAMPEYEVVGLAHDAYEAREMLIDLEPDIMTLDIIMPKINGLDFLRRLSKVRPMPVLICSTIAKAGTQIEKDAYAAGASGVIDKDSLRLYSGVEVVAAKIKPAIKAAEVKFSPNRLNFSPKNP